MTVYVLHFDPPFKHARHYVGWTIEENADRRISEHLDLRGSPLVAAAVRAGSAVSVVAVFPGAGKDYERYVKRRKCTTRFCHLCTPGARFPEGVTQAFRDTKHQAIACRSV
jgi:hypothetical protein